MTTQERKQKIKSYGKAYNMIADALKEFPEEMWGYKPAPEKWSIHEIIIHLADSEANSYVRCRRFIAEPGSTVMGYDQDAWAVKLNYANQSTSDALKLFKALRKSSYSVIKKLHKKMWENTVIHSESGVMKMDEWLNIYEEHIPQHIRQMKRNFDDWKSK